MKTAAILITLWACYLCVTSGHRWTTGQWDFRVRPVDDWRVVLRKTHTGRLVWIGPLFVAYGDPWLDTEDKIKLYRGA